MSSSTSSIFTGSSSYSADFSQVITRAQKIASLPITLLENQKSALTAEQSALNNLSSSFSSFQASVIALGSATTAPNVAVSHSDSTVATATASVGALPGVYRITVVDPGSQASATSAAGGANTITDPAKKSISSVSSFSLTANGKVFSNIKAPNNLNSLAEAINKAAKDDVRATVVNMGTTAAPSYQLSIQNVKYGPLAITLNDGVGGPNLLGTPTVATSVQYRVNGLPASPESPLSSDSRTVTLTPSLTAAVLKVGTDEITVSQSTTSMANALSAFADSYNATTRVLDGHRGTSGGVLAGQSIISSLSQSMRGIANYSRPGSVSSMASLGLTFDKEGALRFDGTVLAATAAKDLAGVTAFLGSTTGGGFLKTANDTLNSISDSSSGMIPAMLLSVAGEIRDTGLRISENQDRVDNLTESLNAQMAAADALIASLQQQATYFNNMFASMLANQNSMR
jgi:flagellar hook-associated protein 2